MSNRTRRQATDRADARRRSRQLERGDEVDYAEEDEPSLEAGARPSGPAGLFGRLFPPAPRLPGKPDPLASFTYSGPFRGVVAGLYLVALNPRGWLLPGIAWAVAQTVSYINLLTASAYTRQFGVAPPNYGLIEIVGLLGTVFAVVAAGWIGWQRPWLYGLVAAVIGYLLYTIYVIVALAGNPALNEPGATTQAALFLITNGVLQAGIGALAGFYGGYLRRRIADPSARQQSAARRRR